MSTKIRFADDLSLAKIDALNLPTDVKSMADWLCTKYGPGWEGEEMEIFSELGKHQTDNQVIKDPEQYLPVLYAFYKNRFYVSKGLLQSIAPPKTKKAYKGKLSPMQAYVKAIEDMVTAAGGTLPVKPVITRTRTRKPKSGAVPMPTPVAA
jgi:hypothetical protein